MNHQSSPRDLRSQVETRSDVDSPARSGAGAARILAATLSLCVPVIAQSASEARVARPIPAAQDVKTEAPPILEKAHAHVAEKSDALSMPLAKSASSAREHGRTARIDHTKVIYDESSADALRVRGATYKAEFASSGVTYIPFFGSRAAKNHPVSLSVESVSVGGRPLSFERDAKGSRRDESVSFERGSLTEVYDVGSTSIEQKFVFAKNPGSFAGEDIDVVVGVGCDMNRGASDDALELRNDLGRVRYSRAEVVDAAGHRAPASTEWAGDAIHIEVAGSFLAQATFPVTIDPLISTFSVDNSSDDDFAPDVAFDKTTGRWVMVYEEVFSATDHDVIATLAESDGLGVPFGIFYVDDTPEDWRKPRVANNNVADQFLIVAQVTGAISHSISGRLLSADGAFGGPLGPKFAISNEGPYDMLNPDVGGDTSEASPSYYCVVWERIYNPGDHDIHACLVSNDGTVSPAIYVDNSSGTLDTTPTISKSDGMPPFASQEWTLAWVREFDPFDHDIIGAQIHWDGAITNAPFPMLISGSDQSAPRVSPLLDGGVGPRPYMLVCEVEFAAGDRDIQGALFTGSLPSQVVNLSQIDAFPTWAKNQVEPSIDTDGHQFVVGYAEQFSVGSTIYDTYLTTFNSAGSVIGLTEPRVQLTNTNGTDDQMSIAAMHSGGADANMFMAGWRAYTAAHGDDIMAALYETTAGGPKTSFCFGTNAACPCGNGGSASNGCGNSQQVDGAHLDAIGTAQVSADSLVLQGSNMPSPSTCLYFQGSGTNPHVVGDGLICAGGGLVRLGAKANVNGASTFGAGNDPHVSVKGNVPAAGATRYYQIWYRDNHNFCMPETYNFSNGVSVVWVP